MHACIVVVAASTRIGTSACMCRNAHVVDVDSSARCVHANDELASALDADVARRIGHFATLLIMTSR